MKKNYSKIALGLATLLFIVFAVLIKVNIKEYPIKPLSVSVYFVGFMQLLMLPYMAFYISLVTVLFLKTPFAIKYSKIILGVVSVLILIYTTASIGIFLASANIIRTFISSLTLSLLTNYAKYMFIYLGFVFALTLTASKNQI